MKSSMMFFLAVLLTGGVFAGEPDTGFRCVFDFENGFRDDVSGTVLESVGAVESAPGVVGKAVKFNQRTGPSFLVAPDGGKSIPTGGTGDGKFTVSFWFKLSGSARGNFRMLAGAARKAGERNWTIAWVPGGLEFLVRGRDGAKNITARTGTMLTLNPDGWNHVVAVCDGESASISAAALDLESHTAHLQRVPLPGGGSAANALPLVIGGRETGDKASELLDGYLDEFAIFDGALDPAGIDRLFQAGKQGIPVGKAFRSAPAAPAEPRILFEAKNGAASGTLSFCEELAYGDFAVTLRVAPAKWTAPLELEIGADGFRFDPETRTIGNFGNFGPPDFRKQPLKASFPAGTTDFTVGRAGPELFVKAGGTELYRVPHTRDTIGAVSISGDTGALEQLAVAGDLRTFPVRNTVFAMGEGDTEFFAIPSLLRAADGSLLAFAEARYTPFGTTDIGQNDIAYKRSTDGGKTWSEYRTVYGGKLGCNNPTALLDRDTGRIHLMFSVCAKLFDGFRVIHLFSDDHGASWSEPADITEQVIAAGESLITPGPGHGIQVREGKYAGRLVFPAWRLEGRGGWRASPKTIYSDDHGKSWKAGNPAPQGADECQIAEIGKDRLLLYTRPAPRPQGALLWSYFMATSTDGGVTWSDYEPITDFRAASCQRAILADEQGRLYTTCPGSGSWGSGVPSRAGLTLLVSEDGGRSWKERRLLDPNRSSYSDLTWLPDRKLGCLYDSGIRRNNHAVSYIEIPVSE